MAISMFKSFLICASNEFSVISAEKHSTGLFLYLNWKFWITSASSSLNLKVVFVVRKVILDSGWQAALCKLLGYIIFPVNCIRTIRITSDVNHDLGLATQLAKLRYDNIIITYAIKLWLRIFLFPLAWFSYVVS